MWDDDTYPIAPSAFQEPIPVPVGEPDAAPEAWFTVADNWVPFLRGAINAGLPARTWDTTDPATLQLVQERVLKLLDMFAGLAGAPIQVTPLNELQISPDGGNTWITVVVCSAMDTLSVPYPIPPGKSYLGNGAPGPWLWNGVQQIITSV